MLSGILHYKVSLILSDFLFIMYSSDEHHVQTLPAFNEYTELGHIHLNSCRSDLIILQQNGSLGKLKERRRKKQLANFRNVYLSNVYM